MAFPRLSPIPVVWDIVLPQNKTNITGDKTVVVWKAPRACQVIDGGFYTPETAVAASKTNYMAIWLYNAGAAGTGTSTIAVSSNYNTTVAAASVNLMTLSATYAKLDADDYVSVKYDEKGTVVAGRFHGCFHVVYGTQS